MVLVVRPHRLARGRGRRLREPRALRCRPGHGESLLDADDVVTPDERAAVVVLDRLGARAGSLGNFCDLCVGDDVRDDALLRKRRQIDRNQRKCAEA